MSSCKEEELIIGTLEVTYTNNPTDLTVFISPSENPQIIISPSLKPNSKGKLTYNLNYGNYSLCWCSSPTKPLPTKPC
jgi:hypothetical protein